MRMQRLIESARRTRGGGLCLVRAVPRTRVHICTQYVLCEFVCVCVSVYSTRPIRLAVIDGVSSI